MKSVRMDGIKMLHVTDTECERFVELQWPENHYRNPGVLKFVEFSQKYFEKYR